MTTALNFKPGIDLPKWRSISPSPLAFSLSNSVFSVIVSDLRNNEDRHPYIYHIHATNTFAAYNMKSDDWITIANFSLSSNVSDAFFMSSQGPRGTITAGATTSSFTLSTALPATVGVNQLANRGDGRGFKVRIIGNSAGGSGKIEERYIVANTTGTTPTINVDTPFSFTPATGDAYEFLSGRIFIFGTGTTAGSWKYYDVLTNSFSGNLSVTNLVNIDANLNILVGLDELLVPYDRNPGEGFLGILTTTSSGVTSLTGQASGGDAGLVANQYRNFQIRIIQDLINPTAAGQRRNITSHTAGPSPIYTVSAWSVTPSVGAVYVIENNGDRILLWTNTQSTTFTYTISANTWDAGVTFSNRTGGNLSPGCMAQQSFGIEPDSSLNSRHSFIYQFKGSSNILDVFDIAGATTGSWTNNIAYGNQIGISQGSSTQDPVTNQGRYMYISIKNSSQYPLRFDMKNRVLEPYTFLRVPVSASGAKNLVTLPFIDGNTKLTFLIYNTYDTSTTIRLDFSLSITC